MGTATFVIAVFGAVTATSSLTWNIVSWLLAGARGTLELRIGVVIMGGKHITVPAKRRWHDSLDKVLKQNNLSGEVAFFVVIRNKGRVRLSIERCVFINDDGAQFGSTGRPDFGADSFPVVLEPGDSTTIAYRVAPVMAAASALDETRGTRSALRARVELGSGTLLTSQDAVGVL